MAGDDVAVSGRGSLRAVRASVKEEELEPEASLNVRTQDCGHILLITGPPPALSSVASPVQIWVQLYSLSASR